MASISPPSLPPPPPSLPNNHNQQPEAAGASSSSEEDSEPEVEEPQQPQFSEEARRIAEEGLDGLDEENGAIELSSKSGSVLIKKGKKMKNRWLVLDKNILHLKKKASDRKPIKHMTFDLKGNLEVIKNDEEATYLGRCFSINIEGKEELRIFTETREEFAEWWEILNTNKRKLDESSGGGGQKVAAEVNRFEQLWGDDSAATPLAAPIVTIMNGTMNGTNNNGSGNGGPNKSVSLASTTNQDALHPPQYKSYLTKRGGTFKTWRKRWFVLEAFTLQYYKREGDKKPKATVSIGPKCKVLPSVSNKKIKKKRPNAFCLETEGRTYYLDCDDNATKSDWLFNIRKTIEMAKDAIRDYDQQKEKKKQRASLVAVEAEKEKNQSHKSSLSVVSVMGHQDDDTTDEDDSDNESHPEKLGDLPGTSMSSDVANQVGSFNQTQKTPEEKTVEYLSKPATWNRINETNSKINTAQVEFYVIATKMRPPNAKAPSKRRTSALGSVKTMDENKPITASHIRIHQSQFMKTSRLPPNVDLKSLKYSGIGKHLYRSNVVENEAIAVYARACVVDCPVAGDRAVEISVHVEDTRCKTDVEKPWAKARFTVSQLLGCENGKLKVPLVLEQTDTNKKIGLPPGMLDKYGSLADPNRPSVYICLSDVPYSDALQTSICQTWGMQGQTFALRTTSQELLVCREECHESLATFQIPLLYLKLRAAEWVDNLKAVKERCEKLLKIFIEQDETRAREMQNCQEIVEKGEKGTELDASKKRLAALKRELGRRQSTEERSKWVIAHMQSHNRIVSQYSAAIDLLTPLFQQIPPNAYQNKCISLTFKSSARKKDSALRMLPTNLHLCWWKVCQPKQMPVSDSDFEPLNMTHASGSVPSTPGRHSRSNTNGMTKSEKRKTMQLTSVGNWGSERDRTESNVSSATSASSASRLSSLTINGDDSDEDEESNQAHSSNDGMNFQKSFYPDGKGENDTVYDTVTFGAPAAHILGFKKGGLRALLLKRAKLLAGEHLEESEQISTEVRWFYQDDGNDEQGPWDTESMRVWYTDGLLDSKLKTRLSTDQPDDWVPLEVRFPIVEQAFPADYGKEALNTYNESLLAAEFGDGKNKGKKGKDEMRQDAEELTLKIEQRRDLIVCQALSALVLSFSARIEVLGGRSETFLKQLEAVGYLFQVESLVSTHGDEQGMLDDFIEAMKELGKFTFRLSELGGRNVESDLWKKRENLTQIRGRMAATTESSDKYKKLEEAAKILEEHITSSMEGTEEQWYYCDDENNVQGPFPASHMRSWYPDYLDDNVRILKEGESGELWMTIGERFAHCGPFPSPSLAAVRVGKGLQEVSIERGPNEECVVTMKIPPSLWLRLPESLKNGQTIPVFPVLIQQGINEFQSIANITGSRSKLQNGKKKKRKKEIRKKKMNSFFCCAS